MEPRLEIEGGLPLVTRRPSLTPTEVHGEGEAWSSDLDFEYSPRRFQNIIAKHLTLRTRQQGEL
jgi:hypothetical protein